MGDDDIKRVLSEYVFGSEKLYLFERIAESPQRYVGLFRSTSPTLKLIQNVLQSREIRFGEALERIIELLIAQMGYVILPEKRGVFDGQELDFDLYFVDPRTGMYFLVEQKVRDDHDSTKKQGQISNFEQKMMLLKERHGGSFTAIFYFIDPDFNKNARYYASRLEQLASRHQVPIHLLYNGELFAFLKDTTHAWERLMDSLSEWRGAVQQSINLDWDSSPEDTRDALIQAQNSTWQKFIGNDGLWENNGIIRGVIFPKGTALRLISQVLLQSTGRNSLKRREIGRLLEERLRRHYPEQLK